MENKIHCPKCGSDQLTAVKRGFSGKKAVAGALLTGGIGILAGTIGSNKIKVVCLNCGNEFKPGQKTAGNAGRPKLVWNESQKKHVINPAYHSNNKNVVAIIAAIMIMAVVIIVYKLLS